MDSKVEERLEELERRHAGLARASKSLRTAVVVLACALASTIIFNVYISNSRSSVAALDRSGRERMKVQFSDEAPDSVIQSFWDRAGDRKIDFGLASNSSPTLRFLGSGEIGMGHQDGGSFIYIFNDRYEKLVSIEQFSDGRSGFVMRAPDSKSGIFMEIDKGGNPAIKLVDKAGSIIWKTP